MQADLFSEQQPPKLNQLGHSRIQYKEVGTILNKTSGFMADYDYSLNPYSGCAFGCTYCYAAFFARDTVAQENWGYWVDVKANALALLKKYRSKPITGKTVYMSSVTDPYQPIERKIELTRELLKELLHYHQPRLVIQTRSPIVTRDIDLLQQFQHLQVNMTITTDSEEVRKVFEPLCPGNKARLAAIKEVAAAGVQACITMTPLLPVEEPHAFAQSLLDTGISKFIIQPFHPDRGRFTAGTREEAKQLVRKYGWTAERYSEVEGIIKSYIPDLGIGKEGFQPI
ncbi:DNA repair photolyase [Cnuella takakiae]|uniref:DNA repair photolyase n=1 Tax=Cnuella takakiae TaxID=1302690 RepID=A0A1M4TCJ1_9BACT|nr:radical SAM protein [Cnuella takakiae]OLY90709.1 radical SAM protein [Cnuella takakiae]SHE42095.1 DNA repair photolyase [Cnuella takakiae]